MSACSGRHCFAYIAVGVFFALVEASSALAHVVRQNCGSDYKYSACDARTPDKIGAKIARLPPASGPPGRHSYAWRFIVP